MSEISSMCAIVQANTAVANGQPNPQAFIALETELAALNYSNITGSFSLRYWGTQYGEAKLFPILCDMVHYFLRQFEVKEKVTDIQVGQLVARLMAAQPELKIKELLFVLNRALNGDYGPTYQRIGIDTILGWLSRYYHDSATHLEASRLAIKPESTRGTTPWHAVEQRMKDYEAVQREKKRITEKVWGLEKHKQEVKEYREGM